MSTEPEIAAAELRAQAESLKFLNRHVMAQDYANNEANNQALARYIADNSLEWTAENLQTAWEQLTAADRLAPPERRAPEPEDPFRDYPLPESVLAETGDFRTQRTVYAIPRETYRKWFHHRGNFGVQFRARVDFICRGGGRL